MHQPSSIVLINNCVAYEVPTIVIIAFIACFITLRVCPETNYIVHIEGLSQNFVLQEMVKTDFYSQFWCQLSILQYFIQ